jgi:hypothetical protein
MGDLLQRGSDWLIECGFAPLFDPEHLEKHKTLTTVLNLTFRGWRP